VGEVRIDICQPPIGSSGRRSAVGLHSAIRDHHHNVTTESITQTPLSLASPPPLVRRNKSKWLFHLPVPQGPERSQPGVAQALEKPICAWKLRVSPCLNNFTRWRVFLPVLQEVDFSRGHWVFVECLSFVHRGSQLDYKAQSTWFPGGDFSRGQVSVCPPLLGKVIALTTESRDGQEQYWLEQRMYFESFISRWLYRATQPMFLLRLWRSL